MLGMELEDAILRLKEAGYTISLTEIRSKKGMEGNSKKVIRANYFLDGKEKRANIAYSVFKTDISFNRE